VINADGSGDTTLAGGTKSSNTDPVWLPDGTGIAFLGEGDNGGKNLGALYVMDADGSDLRRLAPYEITPGGPPAWTPDGKTLIFSTDSEDYEVIVAIDLASGAVTGVVPKNDEADAFGPVASPR
jgi:Tol biopolymer transport system component